MTVHVPNIDESLATLKWQLQALRASRDALRALLASPWPSLSTPPQTRLGGVWNQHLIRLGRRRSRAPKSLRGPLPCGQLTTPQRKWVVESYRAGQPPQEIGLIVRRPTNVIQSVLANAGVLVVLAFLAASSTAHAQARTITVEWDASLPIADAVVDGYIVSQGTAPGIYGKQTLVDAKTTQLTIVGLLTTATYYFVVQAFNPFEERSLRSNELIVPPIGTTPTKPPPTPSGGGFRAPSVPPLKGPQP